MSYKRNKIKRKFFRQLNRLERIQEKIDKLKIDCKKSETESKKLDKLDIKYEKLDEIFNEFSDYCLEMDIYPILESIDYDKIWDDMIKERKLK